MRGSSAPVPTEVPGCSIHHIQDNPKGSGLATSVGSQYAIDIAFFNSEGKVFDGSQVAEFLGKVGNSKNGVQRPGFNKWCTYLTN